MSRFNQFLKPMLALIVFTALFTHLTTEKLGLFCCNSSHSESQSDSKSAPTIPGQHLECAHSHSLSVPKDDAAVAEPLCLKDLEYSSSNSQFLIESIAQSIDQPPELS